MDLSPDPIWHTDSGGTASEIIALVQQVEISRNIVSRHAQYCAVHPTLPQHCLVCCLLDMDSGQRPGIWQSCTHRSRYGNRPYTNGADVVKSGNVVDAAETM